ncbi:MAG TPA: 16S rRNA (cytosine(1402)-N(4))-methyltransferase RsmH, partial [Candidatus Egerieicola pullicola]|nr:16S rRNA (cytosine(1402)-N(4))-methyltransferase RsmH [Candidatus Egerieicola pullicola]
MEEEKIHTSGYHRPVLLEECLEGLNIRPDGIYVDGTAGGGGHSEAIARRLTTGRLYSLDQDPDAIQEAGQRLAPYAQATVLQTNFADMVAVLAAQGVTQVDGVLLDLGVSSHQLDEGQRGFSYRTDAPLDMRMNQEDRFTAYDVVNGYDQKELTRIISSYGEEKWASRIAAFIVKARKNEPITSTGQLVEIIKAAVPAKARREGPHPAKRTFQAIRIEVNDELGQLRRAMEEFCDVLRPGGRLCVISFHSLEDRIV